MASITPHLLINGKKIPRFFYGTAWKEEKTSELTMQALKSGFTAIDTANQRKHYFEEGVGQGIKQSSKKRDELFLQTKFTYARGQDQRKPYDEADSFSKQVADSFLSSLAHLGTDYIDSYVLHGPFSNRGIQDEDLETWSAMEKLVAAGNVKFLGISNVDPEQLEQLCEQVRVKPTFVQNRCFARLGWDKQTREVSRSKDIVYQGFSLLTANQFELAQPVIVNIAHKYNKTIPQIVFRFSQQLGVITLTGTSRPEHMLEDLDIYDFELAEEDLSTIENIAL